MSDNSSSKPFWLSLLFVAIQVFFVFTLVSPEVLEENMLKEVDYMDGTFGKTSTDAIVLSATSDTDYLFYESGFYDTVKGWIFPKDYLTGKSINEKYFDNDFWLSIDNVLIGLSYNFQFILLRLYGLTPWVFLSAIIITASIISGYLQREVKKHGFEYSSPLKHGLAKRVIYLVPMLFVLFVIFPFAMPVMVAPIFVILISIAISFVVSNTIKRV